MRRNNRLAGRGGPSAAERAAAVRGFLEGVNGRPGVAERRRVGELAAELVAACRDALRFRDGMTAEEWLTIRRLMRDADDGGALVRGDLGPTPEEGEAMVLRLAAD